MTGRRLRSRQAGDLRGPWGSHRARRDEPRQSTVLPPAPTHQRISLHMSTVLPEVLGSVGLICLCTVCPPSAWGQAAGDYAGWAFARDATDFPIRVRCERSDDAVALQLSLPAHKAFDLQM